MDKLHWYDDINLNDSIDRNKVFKKKSKYHNLSLFKDKWIYDKCFDSHCEYFIRLNDDRNCKMYMNMSVNI